MSIPLPNISMESCFVVRDRSCGRAHYVSRKRQMCVLHLIYFYIQPFSAHALTRTFLTHALSYQKSRLLCCPVGVSSVAVLHPPLLKRSRASTSSSPCLPPITTNPSCPYEIDRIITHGRRYVSGDTSVSSLRPSLLFLFLFPLPPSITSPHFRGSAAGGVALELLFMVLHNSGTPH